MNYRIALMALMSVGLTALISSAAPQVDNPLSNMKGLNEGPQANSPKDSQPEDLDSIRPEKVPPLLGFDGSLGISRTSGHGTANYQRVEEFSRDNELLRTAEISSRGSAVIVKVTRSFTPEQRQSLLDQFPGLTEYTESFPNQAGGLDVDLVVGLSRTFEAKSRDHFARKYPDIYREYERHFNSVFGDFRGNVVGGRRAGRDFPKPEIRGTVVKDRLIQRVQGLSEQFGREVQTAETQLDALRSKRDLQIERLGEDHASIRQLNHAISDTETTIAELHKKIKGLDKTIELRKLDRERLKNYPLPEIKKTQTDGK